MVQEPRITPNDGFPFDTDGVTWTLVEPTRHSYASVLRESRYGTTVWVNNTDFTVES